MTGTGEHRVERRTLARLPSGIEVTTAVHRYAGAADGPRVGITAAQHGRELNGTAVCRRLHDRLDPAGMAGTVVVVPVTNPLAFDHRQYMAPDRLDAVNANMNRVWPGDPDGTLVERMAASLWPLLADCDLLVDLHTGSADTLDHVVYTAGDEKARRYAEAFDVDLLLAEAAGEDAPEEWDEWDFSGKLRTTAAAAGIPTVTPELAHARRVDREAVSLGLDGVTNVLRTCGVLPGDPDPVAGHTVARNHVGRVHAEYSGMFRPAPGLDVGAAVAPGDELGVVYSPATFETLETVRADTAGVLYALSQERTAVAGEKVASVAETR